MKKVTLSTIRNAILLIAAAAAFLTTTATAQDNPPVRTIEGVWLVTITPRDCVTGDPLPVAASRQIWTFNVGGTMLSSFGTNIVALSRTAAHGLWERRHGWSEYAYKFVHLRQNSSTLAFAGKQESRGKILLGDSGDEFTTTGTVVVYTPDDIPGAPGCSSAVGTRFKLDE